MVRAKGVAGISALSAYCPRLVCLAFRHIPLLLHLTLRAFSHRHNFSVESTADDGETFSTPCNQTPTEQDRMAKC